MALYLLPFSLSLFFLYNELLLLTIAENQGPVGKNGNAWYRCLFPFSLAQGKDVPCIHFLFLAEGQKGSATPEGIAAARAAARNQTAAGSARQLESRRPHAELLLALLHHTCHKRLGLQEALPSAEKAKVDYRRDGRREGSERRQ